MSAGRAHEITRVCVEGAPCEELQWEDCSGKRQDTTVVATFAACSWQPTAHAPLVPARILALLQEIRELKERKKKRQELLQWGPDL